MNSFSSRNWNWIDNKWWTGELNQDKYCLEVWNIKLQFPLHIDDSFVGELISGLKCFLNRNGKVLWPNNPVTPCLVITCQDGTLSCTYTVLVMGNGVLHPHLTAGVISWWYSSPNQLMSSQTSQYLPPQTTPINLPLNRIYQDELHHCGTQVWKFLSQQRQLPYAFLNWLWFRTEE